MKIPKHPDHTLSVEESLTRLVGAFESMDVTLSMMLSMMTHPCFKRVEWERLDGRCAGYDEPVCIGCSRLNDDKPGENQLTQENTEDEINSGKVEISKLREEFERDIHEEEEVTFCTICDPGDHSPAVVDYEKAKDGEGNYVPFDIGHCNWCDGITIRCYACGEETAVLEHDYNDVIDCSGCAVKFSVVYLGSHRTKDDCYDTGPYVVLVSKENS